MSSFLNFCATLDDVVKMNVTELVNFFLAVRGGDERNFGNQHMGFVHRGAAIEARRGAVAHIGDERHADFVGDFGTALCADREFGRRQSC